MKTLVLHVGTQKTATTTIQKFLAHNSDVLNSKGYAYPIFPFRFKYKSKYRNAMFLTLMAYDKDGEWDIKKEEKRLNYGMREIHTLFETYDNVILSDESQWLNLCRRGDRMKALVEDSREHGYQIKIIVYFRRQDQFMESIWNQLVKSREGYVTSFEEFLKENDYNDYLDYYKEMSFFADLIGDENVIVRRFDEVIRSEEGIVADFMNLIGLEFTGEYEIVLDNANVGLYGNEIHIMELLNQLEEVNHKEHKLFREGLVRCSPNAKEAYRCSEFSEEERRAFMKPYEDGNRKIAERFIRDGKPLFSENYSGAPKRDNDNPYLTDDIVRSLASLDLSFYRKSIQYSQKLESRIRELEEQIEELEGRASSNEQKLDVMDNQMNMWRKLVHPFRSSK